MNIFNAANIDGDSGCGPWAKLHNHHVVSESEMRVNGHVTSVNVQSRFRLEGNLTLLLCLPSLLLFNDQNLSACMYFSGAV